MVIYNELQTSALDQLLRFFLLSNDIHQPFFNV